MKTNVAVFAQNPKTAAVVMATAVAMTGVGSIADTSNTVNGTILLLTAGAEGAIVTKLQMLARATISATTGFLFLRRAGSASGERVLIDTTLLQSVSVSTTVNAVKTPLSGITEVTPLRLAAGDELYVGMSVLASTGITAYAEYTDF